MLNQKPSDHEVFIMSFQNSFSLVSYNALNQRCYLFSLHTRNHVINGINTEQKKSIDDARMRLQVLVIRVFFKLLHHFSTVLWLRVEGVCNIYSNRLPRQNPKSHGESIPYYQLNIDTSRVRFLKSSRLNTTDVQLNCRTSVVIVNS